MAASPVLQVRMSAEELAFLDRIGPTRSAAVRKLLAFAMDTTGEAEFHVPDPEPAVERPKRGPLPKAPEGALRARVRTAPVSTEPLVPMPPAVRAAAKSPFTRDPADCPHKYRSTTDRCLACGDQR